MLMALVRSRWISLACLQHSLQALLSLTDEPPGIGPAVRLTLGKAIPIDS
jgi:hypothetical protein